MDITLICPDCGGSIRVKCEVQMGSIRRLNPGQSPPQAQIEQVFESKPSSSGARAYNQGYDQGFLRFWKVYPILRAKRKAQIAWLKAVKRIGSNRDEAQAQILAGAIRYRDDPNRRPEFTSYAATWLSGDGWEDAPLPPRLGRGIEPAPRRLTQEEQDAEVAAFIAEGP